MRAWCNEARVWRVDLHYYTVSENIWKAGVAEKQSRFMISMNQRQDNLNRRANFLLVHVMIIHRGNAATHLLQEEVAQTSQ